MASFGKRDLGLVLSEDMKDNDLMATEDDTIDRAALEEAHRAKLDPTRRVQRLRPGALPAWVQQEEDEEPPARGFSRSHQDRRGRRGEDEEEDEEEEAADRARRRERGRRRYEAEVVEEGGGDGDGEGEEGDRKPVVVDRRLARLEEARRVAQEGRGGARRRYEAEVVAGPEEEEESEDERPEEEEDEFVAGDVALPVKREEEGAGEGEEDDEEAIARRRAAIRERLKRLQMEEAAAKPEAPASGGEEGSDEEEGDEDDESEYETDTDESEEGGGLLSLPKPIFIPKHKRELVKEQEREEREAEERERQQELARERRKRETRNLVAEEVRKEAEGEQLADDGYGSEAGAPDDADKPEDDALEFEKWRLRELFRIKRDREQRTARAKEKAEVERRRNLTDAERAAEDAALGLNKPKEKAKWKFMQRYHHKGAFYMDDESIRDATDVRLRAADAATGEDKFDIAALPKVMQVKAGKFGRAGRTKYTHLLDQDTTRKAEVPSVWQQSEMDRKMGVVGPVRNKWAHQLAGTGEIDAALARRKKKGT